MAVEADPFGGFRQIFDVRQQGLITPDQIPRLRELPTALAPLHHLLDNLRTGLFLLHAFGQST